MNEDVEGNLLHLLIVFDLLILVELILIILYFIKYFLKFRIYFHHYYYLIIKNYLIIYFKLIEYSR